MSDPQPLRRPVAMALLLWATCVLALWTWRITVYFLDTHGEAMKTLASRLLGL